MNSPIIAPVVALVAWSLVMMLWVYFTRMPAMKRDRLAARDALRFRIQAGVDRVIGFKLPVIRPRSSGSISRPAPVSSADRVGERDAGGGEGRTRRRAGGESGASSGDSGGVARRDLGQGQAYAQRAQPGNEQAGAAEHEQRGCAGDDERPSRGRWSLADNFRFDNQSISEPGNRLDLHRAVAGTF